jgi:RNA polymerase sigma factor (sigma-70 family)
MQQPQFEIMARRVRPHLIAVGRMILLSEDEAEDIAQDTLIRLWNIRGKLDRYDSVDSFAVVVARNLCYSRLRKIHVQSVPIDDKVVQITSEGNPHSRAEENENVEWLSEHIDGLPAAQMMIMKMSQNERMSNSEIADILGINETTVRTALSKARKRLLNELSNRR